ncbi:hypothetical protein J3459_013498 [Metarhizium acridum]|nr:hypothetical protein J3459_013498 [Metarhizium acridum]
MCTWWCRSCQIHQPFTWPFPAFHKLPSHAMMPIIGPVNYTLNACDSSFLDYGRTSFVVRVAHPSINSYRIMTEFTNINGTVPLVSVVRLANAHKAGRKEEKEKVKPYSS